MACARSWTDDLTHMADEGRRLTDAAVWWAVAEVVLKSKSVLACARDLHCSWGVLNRAVLEKGAVFCFNVCSTGSAVFFRSVG